MKRLLVIVALGAAACMPTVAVEAAPVEYVKICDANGPGYFYNPGTDTCIRADAGQKAEEGVAIGLSLPGATVDPGKTFGVAAHMGTFEGQNALGVAGAVRAGDGLTFDGGLGVGLGQGTIGGRAGVNFSW
jgi:hypothetical protein